VVPDGALDAIPARHWYHLNTTTYCSTTSTNWCIATCRRWVMCDINVDVSLSIMPFKCECIPNRSIGLLFITESVSYHLALLFQDANEIYNYIAFL